MKLKVSSPIYRNPVGIQDIYLNKPFWSVSLLSYDSVFTNHSDRIPKTSKVNKQDFIMNIGLSKLNRNKENGKC